MSDDDHLHGVLSEINERQIAALASLVKAGPAAAATPQSSRHKTARRADENEPRTPSAKVPSTPSRAGIFSTTRRKGAAATPGKPLIQAMPAREETLWAQMLSESDLAGVSAQERQRQEAIYELVRTEQSFKELLEELVRVYVVPVQQAKLLSPIEHDLVFSNLVDLVGVHAAFVAALNERRAAQAPVVASIGDLLVDFVGRFSVYVRYSSNQHRMEAEVARLLGTGAGGRALSPFASWAAGLAAKGALAAGARHLMLNPREDLIKPTSRLFQYTLLIRSIADKTPADHVDRAACVAAVAAVESLLKQINEEKRSQENWDRILYLQQAVDFGGAPVVLARSNATRIARESRLAHVTFGKELKQRSRRDFSLLVIGETVLLITESGEHGSSGGGDGKPYRLYRPICHLADVSAVDVADLEPTTGRHLFELRIRAPQDLLVVQAATEDDKRAWMAILGVRRAAGERVGGAAGALRRATSSSSCVSLTAAAPSTAASAPISRGTSSSSGRSGSGAVVAGASDGSLVAEAPPPAVELTDAQMGLEEGERALLRTTVLVKTLRGGAWERFGKGDMLLAYRAATGRSRVIFIRDEDTGRVYSGAAINAWLIPAMPCDRVGERAVKFALPVQPSTIATFHVLARTPALADELHAVVCAYRHLHGHVPDVAAAHKEAEEVRAVAVAVADGGEAADKADGDAAAAVEADSTDAEEANDDDSDDSEEEEEDSESSSEDDDDENDDASVAEVEEDQVVQMAAEMDDLRREVAGLRSELAESKAAIAELLAKREYEQRTLRRMIEKHEARAKKFEAEAAALREALAASAPAVAVVL